MHSFSILLMALLGLFCLIGGVLPGEMAEPLYLSAPFRVLAALLVICLAVSLFLRARQVRSVRMLGSWLLHLGMVLICVGAIYNRIWSREAVIEVIEGQQVSLPEGGFSVQLEKLSPFSRKGTWLKGHVADLVVYSSGKPVRAVSVRVNRPAKVGKARLYIDKHGFAPFMEVFSRKGTAFMAGYVSLQTEFGPQVRYWRELGPPDFPEKFTAVFRPAPDGPYLRAPSMKMAFHGHNDFAVLRPGVPVKHGGYEYHMGDVRYWAQLRVAKDPALGLVFTGFWMAVAGASAALLPRVFHADA